MLTVVLSVSFRTIALLRVIQNLQNLYKVILIQNRHFHTLHVLTTTVNSLLQTSLRTTLKLSSKISELAMEGK